jgi:hypothetical protein
LRQTGAYLLVEKVSPAQATSDTRNLNTLSEGAAALFHRGPKLELPHLAQSDVNALAARHSLHNSFSTLRPRQSPGRLMPYGREQLDSYRPGRPCTPAEFLRGEMRRTAGHASNEIDFVLNLKTAKALGIRSRRPSWRTQPPRLNKTR